MKIKGFVIVVLGAVAVAPTTYAADVPPQLATRSGLELGAQISNYRYEEPSIDVTLKGRKHGATASYTYIEPGKDVFLRFDARYAKGKLKYEGSGTKDDVPDKSTEIRLTFGGDILLNQRVSVTPYVGYGYRHLANDLRGASSTGALGYRRDSYYRYLPLGATFHVDIGARWTVAPTIEYDHFLGGTQFTRLSDTGIAGTSDASNVQKEGYGYRTSVLFERGPFAFGPWMHYWKIKDSNVEFFGPAFGFGLEPSNWTREYGFEFKFRF